MTKTKSTRRGTKLSERERAARGEPIPRPEKRGRKKREKPVESESERWSDLWGCTFDSGTERRCGDYLCHRQERGEIRDLKRQVRVVLTPARKGRRLSWRIDFYYVECRTDIPAWNEVKGKDLGDWSLFRNAWAAGLGLGLLRITREGKYPNPWIHEDIWPKKIIHKGLTADTEVGEGEAKG